MATSAVRTFTCYITRLLSAPFEARLVHAPTNTSPIIRDIFNPSDYNRPHVYYIEGRTRGAVMDAGDVNVHHRGAPTPQMSLCRRNPKGAWVLQAISALLIVNDGQRCATTSPPPRALISPPKPHARNTPSYSDRLPVTAINWKIAARPASNEHIIHFCENSERQL